MMPNLRPLYWAVARICAQLREDVDLDIFREPDPDRQGAVASRASKSRFGFALIKTTYIYAVTDENLIVWPYRKYTQ